MRKMNVASTLQTVYEQGPLVLDDLHRITGLSRRTLEPIVSDLFSQGWLEEAVPSVESKRSVGRPARVIDFNASAGCVLVAVIDFRRLTLDVVDLRGRTVTTRRSTLSSSLGREERMQHFFAEVAKLLESVDLVRSDVLAVTISTPGIVQDDGVVDLPAKFVDWSGFILRDRILEKFDCPVEVENDAKLAAFGEAFLSNKSSAGSFLWLRADGVRVGLGIVINGKLYRGLNGSAGEVGRADLLNFRAAQSSPFIGLIDSQHPLREDSQRLLRAARAGDPEALRHVDALAEILAPGLEALAWVLAPEEIVIGGAFAELGELLVQSINSRLKNDSHHISARIRTSESTERAIQTGAVQVALGVVRTNMFSAG